MNPNERDALVDQVVTEIYDAYPWLWAEFGQHGRERTKEDNYHHIDHLYTAYEMKSADFFLDYTLWLQNVEEKEKLEEAIEQNNRLSAPFIELTKDTALVPLFGDLTSDKMQAVEDYLLKASQKEEIDQLLFDFTAVGEINRESIYMLVNLITSQFYMGIEIITSGVRPKQAKMLHELNLPLQVSFIHSLQQAIAKYCT